MRVQNDKCFDKDSYECSLSLQWFQQRLRGSGFSHYLLVRRETFVPGRYCFQHIASFVQVSLPCAWYIRFSLPQCTVHVFPTTPWPAFFFVAPIKFVLVSRVTQMTIHKWNKKVESYRRFYSRVYSQVQTRMSTNKKVLSRSVKFLFRRANAIKNASLNLRTGDFLTITSIAKRLMICLVDNL